MLKSVFNRMSYLHAKSIVRPVGFIIFFVVMKVSDVPSIFALPIKVLIEEYSVQKRYLMKEN